MKNNMTIQNMKYCLFILLLFVMSCCYQEKTSQHALSVPSNNVSLKTLELINLSSRPVEKPAVIYRSSDLGMSWSSFAQGIPQEATISGIKQEGNKVYVITDYHGVFVASDGQDNWTSLNLKQLKGLDINCIEVLANNIIIGTLRNGILLSNDGGLSWNPPNENINSPIRALIKSEDKLYVGTDSGIFESVDLGNTWSHAFGQLQILGFTSLNRKLYAATQNGALVCTGDASNWKSIYDGDALHDIGNDGTYIYAMTIGEQLLKTKNDGASWENAQNGITRPPNFYTNEIQHFGNDIFSAQWIGIYHSSDNGNNWKILKGLPHSMAFSTLEITDYGIIAGISMR